MFTFAGLIIGALLGLRFKVFVLAPAITIGSAGALAIGIALNDGLSSIVLAMAVTIAALQVGYFSGMAIGARKKPVAQFVPSRAR